MTCPLCGRVRNNLVARCHTVLKLHVQLSYRRRFVLLRVLLAASGMHNVLVVAYWARCKLQWIAVVDFVAVVGATSAWSRARLTSGG